jgi:hypothetical protein
LRHFLLAAGVGLSLAAPALAEPAITTAPSTMHRAPNPNSRLVQAVPPNAQIDLVSCTGDWCYASWRHLSGYIPAYAVAQGAAPPPPVIVEAPPIVIGPTFGFGFGHPYGWDGYYGYGWRHW